jgi:hypothetical protein
MNKYAGVKFYKRHLSGMNSEQHLQINQDGTFRRIENISLGAHITYGLCPTDFKVNEKMPKGFLAKFGFKPLHLSDDAQYVLGTDDEAMTPGNYCGELN